jgi:hypothetical protein
MFVISLLTGGTFSGSAPAASAQPSSSGIYFPPAGESIANQFLTTPQEVGLNASIITDLESVIVAGRWALWRHGYLVHLVGDFNANTEITSGRKTVHAATVGAGIQRGLIPSLQQRLRVWNPELTGADADATWAHALTETSTFDEPTLAPGSLWAYSDANAFQLNRALSRVWGNPDFTANYDAVVADALFDPIGAQGWSTSVGSDGIRLHMDLEDLGRVGLLLVTGGEWVDNRLIPEWFVDRLITKQTYGIPPDYDNANNGHTGLQVEDFPDSPYGLMTWVNTDQDLYPAAAATWAVGLGAEGHYLAFDPASGIVLAVEHGDFAPQPGNPPGWPIPISVAVETIQQNIERPNPLVTTTANGAADTVFPGTTWESRTPEEVGISEVKLDEFRSAIGGSGPGVIVKDGYRVYTWGDQAAHGGWASASKAVFSTLLFLLLTRAS